jgi:hypothetical protein
VRLHVAPNDAVGGGLLFFTFGVDEPRAVGPDVTATDAAFEIDAYTDWALNSNVTVSFVGAFANPGRAVQQSTGRTRNFGYGMVYMGYSF